jgi:hypothetical protein
VCTACLLRKRNRKGGRKRRFGLSCPAAGGEEIRAPEEKELRGSGAWSFCSRRWQGWGTEVNCSSRRWRGWGISGGCRAETEQKQSRAKGRRERGFPKDLFVILENYRDLLVKTNLTTVLGLKHKCDQNESCTTFQALQLCFKV